MRYRVFTSLALASAALVTISISHSPGSTDDCQPDAPPSVDPRPRKGPRAKDWEQGQYRRRSHR